MNYSKKYYSPSVGVLIGALLKEIKPLFTEKIVNEYWNISIMRATCEFLDYNEVDGRIKINKFFIECYYEM